MVSLVRVGNLVMKFIKVHFLIMFLSPNLGVLQVEPRQVVEKHLSELDLVLRLFFH